MFFPQARKKSNQSYGIDVLGTFDDDDTSFLPVFPAMPYSYSTILILTAWRPVIASKWILLKRGASSVVSIIRVIIQGKNSDSHFRALPVYIGSPLLQFPI